MITNEYFPYGDFIHFMIDLLGKNKQNHLEIWANISKLTF
jgi:hypothetical protein